MLDMFVCLVSLHKRILNCCTTLDGLDSNNCTVSMDLNITSIKYKVKLSMNRSDSDWRKICEEDEQRKLYNKYLLELTSWDMSYNNFCKAVVRAGKETAVAIDRKCEGWYTASKCILAPAIQEKNQLHQCLHDRSGLSPDKVTGIQDQLTVINKRNYDLVELAKACWYKGICEKIYKMSMDPRLAWENIRILTGGNTAHHKANLNMSMCLANGELALNANKNITVFGVHFNKVLNNQRLVDYSILNLLEQKPCLTLINNPITFSKVKRAINELKKGKSPGLNGIPSEALKAMDNTLQRTVHCHLCDFFEGKIDHKGWHKSQCIHVPKQGNLSNPNKWQGIMLMDMCSKVFLLVMTARAFTLLNKHGTRFQFGGTPEIGCRDGLFKLKALLNAQHNHDLTLYVGFINLVKAYDTANHKLLIDILRWYGAPSKFATAIETIYRNNTCVLKIKNEVEEIPQSVGVRQGDNMAPVLFLFLMTAFTETLELVWKQMYIPILSVMTATDKSLADGKICSHTSAMFKSKKLTAYEILQCLYVDDGTFPFGTREDLQ